MRDRSSSRDTITRLPEHNLGPTNGFREDGVVAGQVSERLSRCMVKALERLGSDFRRAAIRLRKEHVEADDRTTMLDDLRNHLRHHRTRPWPLPQSLQAPLVDVDDRSKLLARHTRIHQLIDVEGFQAHGFCGTGIPDPQCQKAREKQEAEDSPGSEMARLLLSRAITMVVPMGCRPMLQAFRPGIRWAYVASPVGRDLRSIRSDTSRDASYPHRMRSVERGRAPAMFNCAERVSPLKKVMVADTTLPSPASRLSSPIEALRAKPLRVATRSSGPISTISLPLTKTSMSVTVPLGSGASEDRDIDLLGRGQDGGSARVVDLVEPGEIGILADAKGGDPRSINDHSTSRSHPRSSPARHRRRGSRGSCFLLPDRGFPAGHWPLSGHWRNSFALRHPDLSGNLRSQHRLSGRD